MANQLNIQIGAEVNDALRGLQQVEQQSQRTFQKVAQTSAQAGTAVNNLSRIVQDAPFGFIGISNNLQPLFDNFTKLKSETGSVGGAFKSFASSLTGPAGLGLAFAAISTAITFASTGFNNWFKRTREAKESTDEYTKSVKEATNVVAQESAKISTLVEFIKLETTTKKERNNAIKELQSLAPGYFANLNAEKSSIQDITVAYDRYLLSLRKSVEARVIEKQLQDVIAKRLDLEKQLSVGRPVETEVRNGRVVVTAYNAIYGSVQEVNNLTKELNATRQKELDLSKQLAILQPPKFKTEDFKVPKIKQEKPLNLVFQPIFTQARGENPVLEALKPKQLTEYEKIGQIINQNIQKGIKSVEIGKDGPFDEALKNQRLALEEQLRIAQGVARGISDAFGQAFNSILEGQNVFSALGEALKGFVLELVQATIKALIFRAIVNAFVPGGAQAIGATGIANLLGFRANGGPVTGRSPYIVGERGPELFVPSVSGNIVPNNQLGAFNGRPAFAMGGGGRSIVRGTDILLASARTQRSIARVNG